MNEITASLQNLLITVATVGVAAISAIAITYLIKLKQKASKEIEKIQDEKTRELANNAIDRIYDITVAVVDSIQQELVYDIKKAIEDGIKTKDDLIVLRDEAVSRVLEQITPEVKDAAMTQISDVEKYIEDLVSQEVLVIRLTEAGEMVVEDTVEIED